MQLATDVSPPSSLWMMWCTSHHATGRSQRGQAQCLSRKMTARWRQVLQARTARTLAELDGWLATYRTLWTASLDRLEEHLERRRNP
jgi:hypothetical protein